MSGQTTGAGVQTGKLKRRRFPLHEKVRLVEASLAPNASVSGIALAHGINANLLFKWRRLHERGMLGRRRAVARLMPVQVADQPFGAVSTMETSTLGARQVRPQAAGREILSPGAIHIQLPNAQVRVEGSADEATLRAVLEMLRQ